MTSFRIIISTTRCTTISFSHHLSHLTGLVVVKDELSDFICKNASQISTEPRISLETAERNGR